MVRKKEKKRWERVEEEKREKGRRKERKEKKKAGGKRGRGREVVVSGTAWVGRRAAEREGVRYGLLDDYSCFLIFIILLFPEKNGKEEKSQSKRFVLVWQTEGLKLESPNGVTGDILSRAKVSGRDVKRETIVCSGGGVGSAAWTDNVRRAWGWQWAWQTGGFRGTEEESCIMAQSCISAEHVLDTGEACTLEWPRGRNPDNG